MGWTYTHKDRDVSVKDFFKTEYDYTKGDRSLKVIDCAVVGFREAYLALELLDSAKGSREVFAMVCLLDYQPRDFYNFGYKEMDEMMGPCYYNCPERILNLLTPTDNKYALKWRQKCREVIERRKRIAKLKKGDILEFEDPIKFEGGYEPRSLELIDKRKGLFKEPGRIGGFYFRLTKTTLANSSFRVISRPLGVQKAA